MQRLNRKQLACLSRRLDLKMVVLFGSHARGRASVLSDIDVALVTTRDHVTLKYRDEVCAELAALMDSPRIDVVFLNDADPFLQHSIAQEGRCLYERERGGFRKFQLYALKMREDAEKLLRWRQAHTARDLEALGA